MDTRPTQCTDPQGPRSEPQTSGFTKILSSVGDDFLTQDTLVSDGSDPSRCERRGDSPLYTPRCEWFGLGSVTTVECPNSTPWKRSRWTKEGGPRGGCNKRELTNRETNVCPDRIPTLGLRHPSPRSWVPEAHLRTTTDGLFPADFTKKTHTNMVES